MTVRRRLWLCAALAAIPLSLAVGWCWNAAYEPQYLARARLSVPAGAIEQTTGELLLPNLEETLLGPEVVTSAVESLQEQGCPFATSCRQESELDFLLTRLETSVARHGDRDEVEVTLRTTDAEHAVAMLTAVVDAGLQALRSQIPDYEDRGKGGREREFQELQNAIADQQSQIAMLEGRIASAAGLEQLPEDHAGLEALQSALVELKDRRTELEERFQAVRRDALAGVSIEQIAASLPEGEAWDATRELVGTARLRSELRRQEAELRDAAAVYGKNHPRMIALRTQLEQARRKLGLIAGAAASLVRTAEFSEADADEGAAENPAEIMLRTLSEQCRQAREAEEQLQNRLADFSEQCQERSQLAVRLEQSRQELTFLHKERDRVQAEIDEHRQIVEEYRPHVIEEATLSPEPIVPSLAMHLLWAGAIGLVAGGGLWRHFRRLPGGVALAARVITPPESVSRGRSREDEILARLRRLNPNA